MSNQQLAERRRRAVTPAAYSSHPVYPVRGEGAYVWDADGKRYLDWTVGIAVMNVVLPEIKSSYSHVVVVLMVVRHPPIPITLPFIPNNPF